MTGEGRRSPDAANCWNTLAPTGGEGRGEGVIGVQTNELFLNNLLREDGHALRYDKVVSADGEEETTD